MATVPSSLKATPSETAAAFSAIEKLVKKTAGSTKVQKPKTKAAPASTPSTLSQQLYALYPPNLTEWTAALANSITAGQPVDRGYDVNASAIQGTRRAIALRNSNSILSDGDYQMSIFISALNLDSALSGATAQSQLTRDWYPRNFVQPTITLMGWSLDQGDYGALCEFVHSAQLKAITSPGYNNLTQITVAGRSTSPDFRSAGIDGNRMGDASTPAVRISNPSALMKSHASDPPGAPPGVFYNQHIRGSHKPLVAKGYISSMPRIHQAFQNAVQWEIDFVVAVMLQGLYSEQAAAPSTGAMPMWSAMLAAAQKDGVFVATKAVMKENKAALAFAARNSTSLPDAETGAPAGTNTGAATASVTSNVAGVMYDTANTPVTSAGIPANPDAVAGYNQGKFLTYAPLVAAFPNALHLSICVQADGIADCLDIEPGNASPSDAGPWAKKMIAMGASRPCIYSDGSDMPQCQASLQQAGLARDAYRLWLATDSQTPGLVSGMDAVQYKFGPAGGSDISSYSSTFFA
jgi:hypothetical protein